MEYSNFIGIDVSKKTFNVCVRTHIRELFFAEIENTPREIKRFIRSLKEQGVLATNTLICLEHTGVYGYHILEVFYEKGYSLWLEHPLHIKQSIGMTRGKNDEVDSSRIASYCIRFIDKLKLWEPERSAVKALKKLFGVRETLVKTKKRLAHSSSEPQQYESKESKKLSSQHMNPVLKVIGLELKKVNENIRDLILKDERLKALSIIVKSVPGIGEVTSWKLLTVTNEFKSFKTGRQFACYSGVVPFDHQSGTSIKGKPRVSNMANKDMKCLLHMGALSIINGRKGELYDYYIRRVEEGKHKMSVINAIRNKVLSRVFSCVKKMEKYEAYSVG